jgi:hypothetical protein
MKFSLVSLCLAMAVMAVPSPQMDNYGSRGHGTGSSPGAGGSGVGALGSLGSMLDSPAMASMAGTMMIPLPLYKTTTSQPVSRQPDAIRKQLYYGPLALKPARVRSHALLKDLKTNKT